MATSDDCFRPPPTTQHTETGVERARSPPHLPATGSWRERYNSRYRIRTPESANGPRRIRSDTLDRSPPQSIGRGGFGSGLSDRGSESVRGPRQARARSRNQESRSGSVSEGHHSPEDEGESRKKVDRYDAGQTGRGGAGNFQSGRGSAGNTRFERYSPGSSDEGESRKTVDRYDVEQTERGGAGNLRISTTESRVARRILSQGADVLNDKELGDINSTPESHTRHTKHRS